MKRVLIDREAFKTNTIHSKTRRNIYFLTEENNLNNFGWEMLLGRTGSKMADETIRTYVWGIHRTRLMDSFF